MMLFFAMKSENKPTCLFLDWLTTDVSDVWPRWLTEWKTKTILQVRRDWFPNYCEFHDVNGETNITFRIMWIDINCDVYKKVYYAVLLT